MAWQHGKKCMEDRYSLDPAQSHGIVSALMHLWRSVIAGLLAFWMPLCCCQIAAIAGTGAPCCAAPAGADRAGQAAEARASASDGCCSPREVPSCCAPAKAPACCSDGSDADDATHCTPEDHDGASPAGEPCTCCATKAPAPEQDPVDPILSAHSTAAAVPASLLVSHMGTVSAVACTGPPDGEGRARWETGPWRCARAADRCAHLSCWTE